MQWLSPSRTQRGVWTEAVWATLLFGVPFSFGVFATLFFRRITRPFRPIVSAARREAPTLHGGEQLLRFCDKCAERTKTARAANEASVESPLNDITDSDRFHKRMRTALLNRDITLLSEEFMQLYYVKFMYLIVEKIQQHGGRLGSKVDAGLMKVRATCMDKIDVLADIHLQQATLECILLDVLRNSEDMSTAFAGGLPVQKKYGQLMQLVKFITTSTSSDTQSDDESMDGQMSDNPSTELAHSIQRRYDKDCKQLSKAEPSKAEYDRFDIEKTTAPRPPPSIRPGSPPPSPPRSRSPKTPSHSGSSGNSSRSESPASEARRRRPSQLLPADLPPSPPSSLDNVPPDPGSRASLKDITSATSSVFSMT